MTRRRSALAAIPLLLLGAGCSQMASLRPQAEVARRLGTSGVPSAATRPEAPPLARVFLVGDAGIAIGENAESVWNASNCPRDAAAATSPAALAAETASLARRVERRVRIFRQLRTDLEASPAASTAVLWLGDNVYDVGIDPAWLEKWNVIMQAGCFNPAADPEIAANYAALLFQVQMSALAQEAVFVPGNHDWASLISAADDGDMRIKAQAELVRKAATVLGRQDYIRFLPTALGKGPETVDLTLGSRTVRVVALDTEALIQDADGSLAACAASRYETCPFAESLGRAIAGGGEDVIVIGHHPVLTFGPHGNKVPLTWKLWEAPVAFLRGLVAHSQDMAGTKNKRLASALRKGFSAHPPLAYATGHEHVLHVLREKGRSPWHLIAGSASKNSPVAKGPGPDIRSSGNGYMFLDFLPSGVVHLEVVEAPSTGDPKRNRIRIR